ncbi:MULTISPECIES: CsbD family protein [Xanthomonas]|uniref:CsbD family protein n=1 Tax=Xanthomonas dyei TaxID=743699 RepID=A0ABZ0DFE8_9XANT|nr:CsbD family protein [Xanthomonas dyei]WOB26540.1 CsbD family protein [Xanthomonas dyei]WOB54159.1 CsbD family protein [Xanthomonas dyei]
MDKNRIEGTAKQIKGSVKEAVGRVTGDKSTELEGAAEKNIGKVQAMAGEVADKVRNAAK